MDTTPDYKKVRKTTLHTFTSFSFFSPYPCPSSSVPPAPVLAPSPTPAPAPTLPGQLWEDSQVEREHLVLEMEAMREELQLTKMRLEDALLVGVTHITSPPVLS